MTSTEQTESRADLIERLARASVDPHVAKADRRRAREDVARLQQQVRDEWAAKHREEWKP